MYSPTESEEKSVFPTEIRAESVLSAWINLAKERAQSNRVKAMEFEHTPMNLRLLQHLERSVVAQKEQLSKDVYEELTKILEIHQTDFSTKKIDPNGLFSRREITPVERFTSQSKPSAVHQDPSATV